MGGAHKCGLTWPCGAVAAIRLRLQSERTLHRAHSGQRCKALCGILVVVLAGAGGAAPEPPASSRGRHELGGADDYAAMRSMWLAGKVGGRILNKATPAPPATDAVGHYAASGAAVQTRQAAPAPTAARKGHAGGQAKAVPARLGGGLTGVVKGRAPLRPVHSVGRGAGGGGPRDCTITLAFVSRYRFAATSSFPPKEVSDAYKMNMGRYEPDTKRWTFPFEQYDKLSSRLQHLCRTPTPGFNLSFKGIPDSVVAIIREGLSRSTVDAAMHANATINQDATAMALFEMIPQHVRHSLMEFQREGVLLALRKTGAC